MVVSRNLFLRAGICRGRYSPVAVIIAVSIWVSGCGDRKEGGKAPGNSSGSEGAGACRIIVQLAEATTISHPFKVVESPLAANGKSVAVPPGAGESPGILKASFEVPESRKYSVWVRVYWGTDKEEACSNSVLLGIDDADPVTVTDNVFNSWHWLEVRTPGPGNDGVWLKKGRHAVRLLNREDGIELDQALITPWYEDEFMRYVPDGIQEG